MLIDESGIWRTRLERGIPFDTNNNVSSTDSSHSAIFTARHTKIFQISDLLQIAIVIYAGRRIAIQLVAKIFGRR